MAEISPSKEVRYIFKEILNAANERLQFFGLLQSSLFYNHDIPHYCIAQISRYPHWHVKKKGKLTEAAVRTWMFDD
jgi:hypothetical protein